MKVVFLRSALKDVRRIKNKRQIQKIEKVIDDLRAATKLDTIPNTKKLKGHPFAYRIRIGDLRIGVYFTEHTVKIARVLQKSDIYKVFPD